MSDLTRGLRKILNGHDVIIPERMFTHIIDELEAQESAIQALGERLDTISGISANQYERHTNQINQARKDIERLRGVHGA